MSYKIVEYIETPNKLNLFNFDSNNSFYFIPENINEELESTKYIYPESTTDIRKMLKSENITIEYLTSDKPLLRSRKSSDWFGPTLLITYSLLSQNSTLIGISLNLISSYLYDYFKGSTESKQVKFEIILESKKKKEFKKIKYEGSIEGIKELDSVIKGLKK